MNIKNNQTIVFIGDSITDIKFNKRKSKSIKGKFSYPLQVSKQLKKHCKHLKFYYKGIASNRSYHIYDRLTKDCIDLKPDVVIMLFGINDAWENYVPSQYPPLLRPFECHTKEIFRRLKTELPNAQLLVLTPFLIRAVQEKLPFLDYAKDFAGRLKDIACNYTKNIIDLQNAFETAELTISSSSLAIDGVHPTNLGHGIIAKEILKLVIFE